LVSALIREDDRFIMEKRETKSQSPLRLHVGRHAAIWLILRENSSGERFDDKEDLDRFKIPISGFLARWTSSPPPHALCRPTFSATASTKPGNAAGISR
jgi:hypothetical protein